MKLLHLMLLTVCGATLNAQTPGTQLTVDVTVKSLVVQGDTMAVTYVLYNRPTSHDSLWTFTVDAPAPIKSLPRPQPKTSYSVHTMYRTQPVADWTFLSLLPPGVTSIPLTFQSVGVPSIVKYWVGGDYEVTEEGVVDTLSGDPLKYRTVPGNTVGVEPWPVDRTAKALIARLKTLTQTSCAAPLTWITSSSLCTTLFGFLNQAETNRAAGNVNKAKSSMASYTKSLSGKTAGTFASGVTNPGYWLLKPNADIINGVL